MIGRFDNILNKALDAPYGIPAENLAGMLSYDDPGFERDLFAAASEVKRKCGRSEVLVRGLIECSNVCQKDCLYCGIRRSGRDVRRYRMDEDSVAALIGEARRRGYRAVAFQAGEVESDENSAYYERLLGCCKGLEVTLSLGEQREDVYRRWRDAGAMRYLIRIETSNESLYRRIHPAECSFSRRRECIRALKRLGYVTGSGVMIGLPGQTAVDLANDIVFYGAESLGMVGMGPYIPTPGTPMGEGSRRSATDDNEVFRLSLRMIALTRLYMHGINIVASTALEAMDCDGREKGISAGANVVMPKLTPPAESASYHLYPMNRRTFR